MISLGPISTLFSMVSEFEKYKMYVDDLNNLIVKIQNEKTGVSDDDKKNYILSLIHDLYSTPEAGHLVSFLPESGVDEAVNALYAVFEVFVRHNLKPSTTTSSSASVVKVEMK